MLAHLIAGDTTVEFISLHFVKRFENYAKLKISILKLIVEVRSECF